MTPDPHPGVMPSPGPVGGLLAVVVRYQQYLKWPIYSLLFINFVFYIVEDSTTLAREGYQSIWDITGAYATSLDVAGWFGLLLVFEIETYWQQLYSKPRVRLLLNVLRWTCFGVLAHTLVVYTSDLLAVLESEQVPLTEAYCIREGVVLYSLNNQEYTPLSQAACLTLMPERVAAWSFEANTLLDAKGLRIATIQATASFIECAAWLAAGFAFAALARLKRRNTTAGTLAAQTPHISYFLIIVCALTWGWYGHYLYTYDSLLWLGGFAMIEANLSSWQVRFEELMGANRPMPSQ